MWERYSGFIVISHPILLWRQTPPPLPSTPSPGNKTLGNLERLIKNIRFVYGVWSWTPSKEGKLALLLIELRRWISLSPKSR